MSTPTPREQEDAIVDAWHYLGHEGYGCTELRCILPHNKGVLGIGYYDDVDAFVRDCMWANADPRRSNVYVGLNPRPSNFMGAGANKIRSDLRFGGKDADIEFLTTIALDIDPTRPKDTASTAAELMGAIEIVDEAAAWLESKGFARPFRLMSGNGAQMWLSLPPTRIVDVGGTDHVTAALKLFESRVRDRFATPKHKVDSIYNLSRIIKVPGTRSWKGTDDDSERPQRVAMPLGACARVNDEAILAAILALPGLEEAAPKAPPAAAAGSNGVVHEDGRGAENATAAPVDVSGLIGTVSLGHEMSRTVFALVTKDRACKLAFEGRGKPAIGKDGKPLDTSGSGYDYTLASALVAKGVTDIGEIATAIACRPDRHGREKGARYCARTAIRAVETAGRKVMPAGQSSPEPEERNELSFSVQRLVVYASDPPCYELHVTNEREPMMISSSDLMSPGRFCQRYLERYHSLPDVPQDYKRWRAIVNGWLTDSEKVDQPDDASEAAAICLGAASAIDRLAVVSRLEDIGGGQKCVEIEGSRCFKLQTIASALRSDFPTLRRPTLGAALRRIGCSNKVVRVDAVGIARLWIAPVAWPPEVLAGTMDPNDLKEISLMQAQAGAVA